jgi:CHAD domain-containing protein
MSLDVAEITKPARKLRKLMGEMSSTPSPDDIHKFRTNCRRIETSLDALSLDSKGTGRRLSKQISKVRKRAGKIRDVDVLRDDVVAMKHPDSERECRVRLLEHLGGKRRKHVKSFCEARKEYGVELRQDLKKISRKMEKIVSRDAKSRTGTQTTAARVAGAALRKISELREPPRLQRNNLHPYRLKVKQLRALLQMADRAEQRQFIDKLGEVKDAIGEWHDWEVLTGMATAVVDHAKTENCGLVDQLRRTAENKYETALAFANSMRRDFLHLSNRRSKSSKKQPIRLARPVLSATIALAA